MGQQKAAGFYQLVVNASPPAPSTFTPSTDVPVWFEWDATQTSWSSTTGTSQTEGDEYLDSAPNLGSGAGSFTFDGGPHDPSSGQGWVIADSLEGLKLYGNEVSYKAPMTDGVTTNEYSCGPGNYACIYVVTWGGTSSNDTLKNNNNTHHKFSGNSRIECVENWHDQADGLGLVDGNSKVEPDFPLSPSNGVKYLIAFVRDVGSANLSTNNADVPGTYDDGGKTKIYWIPLASGNTWASDLTTADSLDKSITGGSGAGTYSPSYLSDQDVMDDGNDDMEHYFDEDTVLHAHGYTNVVTSESQIETLLESIYDYAQGLWG